MDIFQSQYYRINVKLLTVVGLWPYQKSKSWQLFQQIIFPIMEFSVMLVLGIKMLEVWGNLDMMIECFTPMAVQIGASIKFMNFIIHRKDMIYLLESMQRDWLNLRDKKEIEILSKYAQHSHTLTLIYIVFLSGALFLYLNIPLLPRFLNIILPLNESRPPAFLYDTEYFVDQEEYFIWITLHTYSCTILTMIIVMASDTIYVCYVIHACGVLAVIGYRLERITSKRFKNTNSHCMSKEDDEKCYREIVLCIDQHFNITEVVNIIESSYTISYLLVLGTSVILLSLSSVQLLIKFGEIGEMMRLSLFNVGQCFHLLFSSWPSQKLIDESDKFRESIYASEWYSLSEVNKNLLRFVMLRTLEPQKLTAGKIYVMSMENFGVVIQTSMSYFTVFASIR